MQLQNPDDVLIVVFKDDKYEDEAASLKEGRPIWRSRELCEIRTPGSRDIKHHPAHSISSHGWVIDPFTGRQKQITYAQRFARQYRQYKEMQTQTSVGTPLAFLPFLTAARRAELEALNIYTAEALASIDGQELKNIGIGGREQKNLAQEYIDASLRGAATKQQLAMTEANMARLQMLEDDNKAMREKLQQLEAKKPATPSASTSTQFENMTIDQLREYITATTGHAPHGSLSLKVLQRMAIENAPKANADVGQ